MLYVSFPIELHKKKKKNTVSAWQMLSTPGWILQDSIFQTLTVQ